MAQDTWRTLLARLITDKAERVRIAAQLNKRDETLMRWAQGKVDPHKDNRYELLNVIPPEHRALMARLLKEEFPDFEDVPPEVRPREEVPPLLVQIILDAYCSYASSLRRDTIIGTILEQAAAHLDPEQHYVHIRVAVCSNPFRGKVRSLYVEQDRMPSQIWEDASYVRLLGTESLDGYVVSTLKSLSVENVEREKRVPVDNLDTQDKSVVCFPLLRAGRVVGAVTAASRQAYYFTEQKQHLLRDYARLLSLAFADEEFCDRSDIHLAKMPLVDVQELDYYQYRARVADVVTARGISLDAAEVIVRQELEQSYMRSMIEPVVVKDS